MINDTTDPREPVGGYKLPNTLSERTAEIWCLDGDKNFCMVLLDGGLAKIFGVCSYVQARKICRAHLKSNIIDVQLPNIPGSFTEEVTLK